MPINTQDYINATSGIGPLAKEWTDKPHRLVYDLVRELLAVQRVLDTQTPKTVLVFGDCSSGRFYLVLKDRSDGNARIYYRSGSQILHDTWPTWFSSREAAEKDIKDSEIFAI
jgi:hypothetical protein